MLCHKDNKVLINTRVLGRIAEGLGKVMKLFSSSSKASRAREERPAASKASKEDSVGVSDSIYSDEESASSEEEEEYVLLSGRIPEDILAAASALSWEVEEAAEAADAQRELAQLASARASGGRASRSRCPSIHRNVLLGRLQLRSQHV